MATIMSGSRLRFIAQQLRERLWVKPLFICLLSVGAAFVAKFADATALGEVVPAIALESVESLLSIMAASMLVIATFTVASMVSAYASASSSATPRAFTLVLADDVSQNALSTFIGAFIFSIIALVTVKNEYFGAAGTFTLFVLTIFVFALVVFTFVRWVDRIARLGRIGTTIAKVEQATCEAMKRRHRAPALDGVSLTSHEGGYPVFAPTIGYVQHIDMEALQTCAARAEWRVSVAALPGTFMTPGRPLAFIHGVTGEPTQDRTKPVVRAFILGDQRQFADDPRFGLVVLSEIACRALSPAVNDPGTAIAILGSLVRLFAQWTQPVTTHDRDRASFDRVQVPELALRDMFDDAFTAIARDGAGAVEVALRLQKVLTALAHTGDGAMREAAMHHGRMALARAERALELPQDLALVREAARFATAGAIA